MTEKKRGLGRGLSDLLPSTNWLKREDIQLFYCPVERLSPNPYQPRQSVEDSGLAELAESIRQKGVLQPLIVSKTDEPDSYRIVAGERRWQAARLAELAEVPVILRDASSSEALELALIENIQRQDLNCIEEALAYQRLQQEFALTQEQIAERVGKDRSTVANLVRILQLPSDIQAHILDRRLTMGHARALAGVGDADEQRRLCEIVLTRGLSVRQTEQLVSEQPPQPARAAEKPRNPRVERLESALQSRFGVPVQLRKRGKRGSITISFQSEDEFRELLRRFGVELEQE